MDKTLPTPDTQEPKSAEKVTVINHIARGGRPVKLTVTRIQRQYKEYEPEDWYGGSYVDKYQDDAYVVIEHPDPLKYVPDHVSTYRINRGIGWWQKVKDKWIGDPKEEILKLTTEEKITLYNAMYERLLPWIAPVDEFNIGLYKKAIAEGKIWTRKECDKHHNARRFVLGNEDDEYEGYEVDTVIEEAKRRFPEQLGLSKLAAELTAAAARKKLGKVINEARMAAGLTVRQLEERADTPKSNISRLEGGRANAGIDDYAKLAAALGLEINITPKQD